MTVSPTANTGNFHDVKTARAILRNVSPGVPPQTLQVSGCTAPHSCSMRLLRLTAATGFDTAAVVSGDYRRTSSPRTASTTRWCSVRSRAHRGAAHLPPPRPFQSHAACWATRRRRRHQSQRARGEAARGLYVQGSFTKTWPRILGITATLRHRWVPIGLSMTRASRRTCRSAQHSVVAVGETVSFC